MFLFGFAIRIELCPRFILAHSLRSSRTVRLPLSPIILISSARAACTERGRDAHVDSGGVTNQAGREIYGRGHTH